MNWKNYIRDNEREELERIDASKIAARDVYASFIRKLKSRCEARMKRDIRPDG